MKKPDVTHMTSGFGKLETASGRYHVRTGLRAPLRRELSDSELRRLRVRNAAPLPDVAISKAELLRADRLRARRAIKTLMARQFRISTDIHMIR